MEDDFIQSMHSINIGGSKHEDTEAELEKIVQQERIREILLEFMEPDPGSQNALGWTTLSQEAKQYKLKKSHPTDWSVIFSACFDSPLQQTVEKEQYPTALTEFMLDLPELNSKVEDDPDFMQIDGGSATKSKPINITEWQLTTLAKILLNFATQNQLVIKPLTEAEAQKGKAPWDLATAIAEKHKEEAKEEKEEDRKASSFSFKATQGTFYGKKPHPLPGLGDPKELSFSMGISGKGTKK